jgi:hypothetical protein
MRLPIVQFVDDVRAFINGGNFHRFNIFNQYLIGWIMKVKRANRLISIIDEIWVIHLQKVDTLLLIGIYDKYFHFIPVNMVCITKKSVLSRYVSDIKDLYRKKDMNLGRFNIDCMQVWCVARTSEITHFHFIPVNMVLYIYKYWFKILKRWKFPPLIKVRTSSTNCTSLLWAVKIRNKISNSSLLIIPNIEAKPSFLR